MRIAFLGLGRMGAGMARNLLRAGHDLTLYNRSREKAAGIGAPVADTPASACRDWAATKSSSGCAHAAAMYRC